MIDLHMHSRFSDGTYSPEELVEEAVQRNIFAAVLTDHDTVEGVKPFLQAAASRGLQALSGVEFSTDYAPGHMHLLGYGVDIESPRLQEQLEWVRGGRAARNAEMLEKLNDLGFRISEQEVRDLAGEGVVGRPHIAEVLRLKSFVRSRDEAFKKYLAQGCAAYASRRTLSPESCIRLITETGGAAVLAHPHTLGLSHRDLKGLVKELAAMGLKGIEVYYRRARPRVEKKLLKIAKSHKLMASGGSDFHGGMRPEVFLGTGQGDLAVPDEVWHDLQSRLDTDRNIQQE